MKILAVALFSLLFGAMIGNSVAVKAAKAKQYKAAYNIVFQHISAHDQEVCRNDTNCQDILTFEDTKCID